MEPSEYLLLAECEYQGRTLSSQTVPSTSAAAVYWQRTEI
jgi:hypothetical protein